MASLAEYFLWMTSTVKTILVVLILLSSFLVLVTNIILPASKLYGLTKRLSNEEASKIIGTHFSEIEDKLLNILQLHDQSSQSDILQRTFIEASIEQKAIQLSPIAFYKAVDFKKSWKYIKYAVPPLAVILLVSIIQPHIFGDSAQRLASFSENFVKPAPFSFNLVNNSLSVPQGEEFIVKVDIEGEYIPQFVYLVNPQGELLMRKLEVDQNTFFYKFSALHNSTSIHFLADGFKSASYEIEVLPKPSINALEIQAEFPKYLGLTNKKFTNGDITIPEGTEITWSINGQNIDNAFIKLATDSTYLAFEDDQLAYPKRIKTSSGYQLISLNNSSKLSDTALFQINVIPDLHPKINISSTVDSSYQHILYYTGRVEDDYGFTNLKFYYKSQKESNWKSQKITINSKQLSNEFYHYLDARELGYNYGDQLEYYFEVKDNDGVNGPKSSKSQMATLFVPSEDDLKKDIEETKQDIEDKLAESLKKAKDLQKDFNDIKKDLLQKKDMEWADKKKVEKLLNEHKALQKDLEEIKEKQAENLFKENDVSERSESIMEKQEQLNELFEELIPEELKALYEEMEKLMEENRQDEMLEKMEELNMSDEELEQELDRSLEMFKKMEMEKSIDDISNEMKELAEKQKELSENKEMSSEELQKKQEELQKEFEKLQEKWDEVQEENKELTNPMDLQSTEEKEKEIEENLDKAQEQLNDNKKKGAQKSQKNAGDKMEEMAQQLQSMMQSSAAEQQGEDMEALRALLENIITLSFDQERLSAASKTTNTNDPKYLLIGQEQRKLKDDSKVIKDSLIALSKRVIQIQSIVNREINKVNKHMEGALEQLAERKSAIASSEQQFAMTSLNNLALLLDEALKQMQKQMAEQKPGAKSNCNKPGQGQSQSIGDMKKMQEQLAKELEKMKKGQGSNPGGEKPNQKPGQGMSGMSKKLAQMAAKQAAIRRKLNQMAEELNKDGKGTGNKLREIAKDIEKLEEDIVNKRIDAEAIKKQQQILTRMLEAENAEKEREKSPKRESKTGQQYPRKNNDILLEYEKRKWQEIEMLKSFPAELVPYYKQKVTGYMNQNQ